MTDKRKKFCDEYLKSGNASQSAINAGYSKKTAKSIGQHLLTLVDVKSYIAERMEQVKSQSIADITEVMTYLTRGIRQELEEEVVVTEGVGDGCSDVKIVKKKISLKDSNKCAEMLAKRFGLLTDKVDISGALPVVICGEDELDE